jgi:hypothetical protein
MSQPPNPIIRPSFSSLTGADDLIAIEALSGTGIAARTGTNTWALRTLQPPAAGITITNPAGTAGDPTLALANDLAALEGLSSTGMIARTGDGTAAVRTITAPAAGITVTDGNGVSGNPTLALANDLAAIEGLASTGVIVRTGDGTATTRTITGTADRVTITDGSGVSGNPTADIASTYVGQTSITTLGTVATGTWNATTIGTSKGGTGLTATPTNGQLPIGNGSGYTLATLTAGSNVTITNGAGSITIAASMSSANVGYPCEGRLTMSSTEPVNTGDTSNSLVYFLPYAGNRIALYSGGSWSVLTWSSLSLDVSGLTASIGYDVWAYNNSGSVALDYTAWSSASARATALTRQDGILVKNGDATRRYIGSFYKNTATNTQNGPSARLVWNLYNRVESELYSAETGSSHNYSTATWREWNASTSYRLPYFVGLVEDAPTFTLYGGVSGTGDPRIALAFNSTTSPVTNGVFSIGASTNISTAAVARRGTDAVLGYNYVTALQYTGSGTGTFDKLQLTGVFSC